MNCFCSSFCGRIPSLPVSRLLMLERDTPQSYQPGNTVHCSRRVLVGALGCVPSGSFEVLTRAFTDHRAHSHLSPPPLCATTLNKYSPASLLRNQTSLVVLRAICSVPLHSTLPFPPRMTHTERRSHWLKEGAIGLSTGILYGITSVAGQ
jgi:hypothetical protein